MRPFWMSAFIDFPPEQYAAGAAHWQRLTGWYLPSIENDPDGFSGLRPPGDDPYLYVQRLAEGQHRVHIDLHVDDPVAAAQEAERMGASTVAERPYRVLRSPGGFVFCLVDDRKSAVPAPSSWPDGHTSIVDQVCIDIPAEHWESETAFWRELTGWPPRPAGEPFARLTRADGLPLQILMQRLGEPTGDVRAHLDWATTDRDAETRRQVGEGSEVVEVTDGWTVLTGPGGTYCITDRTP